MLLGTLIDRKLGLMLKPNENFTNFKFRGESVDEVSFIISGSLEVIQDDEVSVATCDCDCGGKCLISVPICLF